MTYFQIHSLKQKIILWTGGLITLVFLLVIAYISINFKNKLEQTIYHDLATKNQGYAYTLSSIFKDRATIILALRNDLELYETRGQMWVHLAAHTGELVFDDPISGQIYRESFQKKLDVYRSNGQLSADKMIPQMQKMLDNIMTRNNAYGEGMKFFYIGVSAPNSDKLLQEYDQYQDSSLWVPDARVDAPYNPLIRPWYLAGQEAGRERVVFTEPYAERRTKEALVSGATAITVEGVQGTLAGGISIKPIMDALLETSQENAHITIFSKGTQQETIYVSTPPKYIYSSRDPALGEHFRAYNDGEIIKTPTNRDIMQLYEITQGQDAGVLEWVINGERRLVAYNTVPDVGWKVFSSVSKQSIMADAMSVQYKNIAISLMGLVVLLYVIFMTVKRSLQPLHTISQELMDLAETGDLSKRVSITSHDEVGQMAKAINEMLDNTAGPVQELGKTVKKIAEGDLKTDINIAAKGDIAQLVNSFNEMTQRLIEFEEVHRDASPLTGLPGGVTIELTVQQRIERGIPFAFCMFDIDNFKPFNDRYGYSHGNLVLKQTAQWIQQALRMYGKEDDFIGHIGGDDFVVIAAPERFKLICEAVIATFDAKIPDFYDQEDRQSGSIISQDRQGQTKVFSIMTLSICAVNSQNKDLQDFIRVGEIAAELKSYAKTLQGSNLVIDQRAS